MLHCNFLLAPFSCNSGAGKTLRSCCITMAKAVGRAGTHKLLGLGAEPHPTTWQLYVKAEATGMGKASDQPLQIAKLSIHSFWVAINRWPLAVRLAIVDAGDYRRSTPSRRAQRSAPTCKASPATAARYRFYVSVGLLICTYACPAWQPADSA